MWKAPAIPDHLIIEEQLRRQREQADRWQPVPLQVPLQNERLYDLDRDAEPKPDQAPQTGGTVIVIDISDL